MDGLLRTNGIYIVIIKLSLMAFWVYILHCGDGSYYTGHTDDIETRLEQHVLSIDTGYTSKRKPLKLIFGDSFPTRVEALEAERKIKKWTRAKKEALINRDWERLKKLSKKKFNKNKKPVRPE